VSQPSRRFSLFGWFGAVLLAVTLAAVSLGLHSPGAGAIDDGQHGNPNRVVTFGFVDVPDGPTAVYPPFAGRIVAVHVRENDPVWARDPKESPWWREAKGTPLFRLDDRQAKEKLAQARADLAAAREQVKQAEEVIDKHNRGVEAQQAKALAKHKAAEAADKAAEAADKVAAEAERLYSKQNLSVEKRDAARLEAEARHKEAEARLKEADAEDAVTKVLEADKPDREIQRAKDLVAAKEAQEREAQLAVDECVVRAPGDGTVLRVNVTPGTVFAPTAPQPAMIFCPNGPRIVRAEVDQEWAGRTFVGQRAVIHDDARSGPEWHGKVTILSDWFTHRRSLLLEPLQLNDVRTLEAIIELDESAARPRIGQRMRVTLEPGQ